MSAPSATYQPLLGVKVLDLSRLVPGALATQRLADLGADVVKVELPGGGDYLRDLPPLVDGEGLMHRVLNRGKRSLELDYRTPAGRALLEQLVAIADVVVEGARPGRLAELGVDPEDLRRRFPALVVCSISGFGQDGPLALLPSHGMNMDSLAGCVRTEVDGDRPILTAGTWTSFGTELGGTNAAVAILAALLGARATGVGAWIDASCWDAAAEAGRFQLAEILATGASSFDVRTMGPLYDLYWSSDDRVVFFGALEPKFWARFCQGIGRTDLEVRWIDGKVHIEDDAALRVELEAVFRSAPANEWSARFLRWDVPGSEVLGPAAVATSDHMRARGLLPGVADGDGFPVICSPIRWMGDDVRPGAGSSPAPTLGHDTDDVLSGWLGLDRHVVG